MDEKFTAVESNFDEIHTDLRKVKTQLRQQTEGETFTLQLIFGK